VLFVDHVAQASGAELALLRLAGALEGRAHLEVAFLQDGPLVDRARGMGLPVHVVPMNALAGRRMADINPLIDMVRFAPRMIGGVRALARICRANDLEIIYTNSEKAHVIGGLAARVSGRRWVAHVRTLFQPPHMPPRLRGAMRAFLTLMRPGAIIANSQATRRALPWGAGRTHVIPSGLVEPATAAQMPAEMGPVLGLLGRLDATKGQDVAIRAMPAIRERFPSARLVIGGDSAHGDPAYARELRVLADSLGVASSVTFTGFVDDPLAFFRAAHIGLLTSVSSEGLGQVVLEALSVGRPVIATTCGGPEEILGGERGGALVRPGDPAELARAVADVFGDETRFAALSAAAVVRARDFTVEASADATLTLLRRIHSRKSSSRPRLSRI
jgi:glycosyltransferase involved in cell wall biosynthesis